MMCGLEVDRLQRTAAPCCPSIQGLGFPKRGPAFAASPAFDQEEEALSLPSESLYPSPGTRRTFARPMSQGGHRAALTSRSFREPTSFGGEVSGNVLGWENVEAQEHGGRNASAASSISSRIVRQRSACDDAMQQMLSMHQAAPLPPVAHHGRQRSSSSMASGTQGCGTVTPPRNATPPLSASASPQRSYAADYGQGPRPATSSVGPTCSEPGTAAPPGPGVSRRLRRCASSDVNEASGVNHRPRTGHSFSAAPGTHQSPPHYMRPSETQSSRDFLQRTFPEPSQHPPGLPTPMRLTRSSSSVPLSQIPSSGRWASLEGKAGTEEVADKIARLCEDIMEQCNSPDDSSGRPRTSTSLRGPVPSPRACGAPPPRGMARGGIGRDLGRRSSAGAGMEIPGYLEDLADSLSGGNSAALLSHSQHLPLHLRNRQRSTGSVSEVPGYLEELAHQVTGGHMAAPQPPSALPLQHPRNRALQRQMSATGLPLAPNSPRQPMPRRQASGSGLPKLHNLRRQMSVADSMMGFCSPPDRSPGQVTAGSPAYSQVRHKKGTLSVSQEFPRISLSDRQLSCGALSTPKAGLPSPHCPPCALDEEAVTPGTGTSVSSSEVTSAGSAVLSSGRVDTEQRGREGSRRVQRVGSTVQQRLHSSGQMREGRQSLRQLTRQGSISCLDNEAGYTVATGKDLVRLLQVQDGSGAREQYFLDDGAEQDGSVQSRHAAHTVMRPAGSSENAPAGDAIGSKQQQQPSRRGGGALSTCKPRTKSGSMGLDLGEGLNLGPGSLGVGGGAQPTKQPRGLRPQEFVLGRPYEDVSVFFALHTKQLGVGQFGVIRKCKELSTGHVFACKTISKTHIQCDEDAEDIRKEVACLTLLHTHPTIIGLKGVFEDSSSIHVVMELMRGGDLLDRINQRGKLPEKDCARLCKSIVEALLHCHCMGIMHRDIKPDNILLKSTDSNTDVKLVDFGVATFFQPGVPLTELIGTPEYMAPEVYQGRYGPKADIWSVGVVLYITLTGGTPFWSSSRDQVRECVLKKELNFRKPVWESISPECKDLVSRMLDKHQDARISAPEILSHSWLQEIGRA